MPRSMWEPRALTARLFGRDARFERLEGRRCLSAASFPALPHGPGFHVAAFEVVAFNATAVPLAVPSADGHHAHSLVVSEKEWAAAPPLNAPVAQRMMTAGAGSGQNADGEAAGRVFVWMPGDPSGLGFSGWATSFAPDEHLRFAELVRESLLEASFAVLAPEAARASINHADHDIGPLEGARHATPGLPAGMGQTVESDRGLEFSRATSGNIGSSVANLDAITNTPPETVSPLVALGGNTPSPADHGSRDHEQGHDSTTASTWHDLLLPRFSCDVATLGAALADFVSEADDLGIGLLSILAEVPSEGELALVAGLVGAGAAYRYARDGQKREWAKEQEVLRARFIGAPACIRLHRSRN